MRSYNFAFIDGANLHLTYEYLDWRLDYQKLRNYLKKKLDVEIAYYFLGNTKDTKPICEHLESYGYAVKLKEPSSYLTEEEYCPYCSKVIAPEIPMYKSDCDSFMTLEIMSNFLVYNQAVIITSDGDFDNLVYRLWQRNKLKMVFAPVKTDARGYC